MTKPAATSPKQQGAPRPSQPVPELEGDQQEPGSGGPEDRRPYHEGAGDQRMRGKRYKAAVQLFYKQKGWVKQDHQHWRDLGPAVGLIEEDSESEWSKVLTRERPRRWPQPTRPAAPATPINWGDLLNRHLLPRDGDKQAGPQAAAAHSGQQQQQGSPEPDQASSNSARQQQGAVEDPATDDARPPPPQPRQQRRAPWRATSTSSFSAMGGGQGQLQRHRSYQ